MLPEEEILPNRYNGSLSMEEIAAGSKAATINAKSLLSAAETLLNTGHYSSAAALAIIAIEESTKPSLLTDIAMCDDKDELKKAWKNFRNHSQKNPFWFYSEFAKLFKHKDSSLRALELGPGMTPYSLDQLKQYSLYVDYYSNHGWFVPLVINEDSAKKVIDYAKVFVNIRESTPKEREMWIKHIKPFYKQLQQKKASFSDAHKVFMAYATEAYSDDPERFKEVEILIEKFLEKPPDKKST